MRKIKTYHKFLTHFSSIFLFFVLVLASCKSTGPAQDDSGKKTGAPQSTKNLLTKYPDAMLWQIDGTAKDGTPSKVYLLGTYHAGDDRVLEFPECVSAALEESDRFCCELSSEVWDQLPEMMQSLTMQSFLTDLSHTLIDDLSEEEITLITQFIDPQTLAQLVCFEPWVMLAADLDAKKAYDVMIMDYVQTQKTIRALTDLMMHRLSLTLFHTATGILSLQYCVTLLRT